MNHMCLRKVFCLFMTAAFLLAASFAYPALEPARAFEQTSEDLLKLYDQEQLLSHIKFLASDELAGRQAGLPGAYQASNYLVSILRSYGLTPWREAGFYGYRQIFPITLPTGRLTTGENVIAVWPGECPDDYLLLTANYDHLGTGDNNEIYYGADDNASSVALLLEFARCLKEAEYRPRKTLVFVFFSGNEAGLLGSQALVSQLEKKELIGSIALLNLERMAPIGGNFLTVYDFEQGERVEGMLASITDELKKGRHKLQTRQQAETDAQILAAAGVPSLGFEWAGTERYHPHRQTPKDNYAKLRPRVIARSTRAMFRIMWRLANE